MKKIYTILAMILMVTIVLAGCGTANTAGSGDAGSAASDDKSTTGKHHVEINVRDYGTIKAELDADEAPITVANFLKLAGDIPPDYSGIYDSGRRSERRRHRRFRGRNSGGV